MLGHCIVQNNITITDGLEFDSCLNFLSELYTKRRLQ